jgi:hypothetical protein
MVKVIKSAVKCYKKKTKKTVGGKRKIYEYNQYLIPLKRSDKFECERRSFHHTSEADSRVNRRRYIHGRRLPKEFRDKKSSRCL